LSKNVIGDYKTEISGILAQSKVEEIIKDSFTNLLKAISSNDLEGTRQYINSFDTDNAISQIQTIDNIKKKVESLNPVSFDMGISEEDSFLIVGKLNFTQKSSKYINSINVVYDRTSRIYKFNNLYETLVQIPKIVKVNPIVSIPNIEDTINCSDCFLAPVDKTHSLPSSYTPSFRNTGFTGGGQLTNDTISALKNLMSDASSKAISISIISSYRSYQTQISTFNYWVNEQKKRGLSQAEAEVRANRISARAGHSEHQLGTTVDIKCLSCGNFDNSSNNLLLYQYLEENAYRFGFVISYPKDKESLTGYSYEPWHIRFIGVDLATEFYNKNYITDVNLSSTILLRK
jgi:D-alanyl-D-alanine carboxypeptidase